MANNFLSSIPIADSWDTNADYWVKIIRENRDRYRTGLTDRAVLEAIGPCAGLNVLDAGCGEGYMSRTLASHGAQVCGIDKSQDLIAAARSHTSSSSVSFEIGDVQALPYEDQTFDLVLCNHLMNDLADPTRPIQEFSRVLTPYGRLVILMLHPCFYVKHSDRATPLHEMPSSAYFDVRSITQHFVVDGLTSPTTTTVWFRPLEFYTQELRRAGLVIESLSEPHPTARQLQADPWWSRNFTRPLFMLLVARQLSMA